MHALTTCVQKAILSSESAKHAKVIVVESQSMMTGKQKTHSIINFSMESIESMGSSFFTVKEGLLLGESLY